MSVFVEAVRAGIEASGRSQYAIAREAGISRSHLGKYVMGKADLSGSNLDRLFAVIGITLTLRAKSPAQEVLPPQCAPIVKPITREAIAPKPLSRPQLSPRDRAKLGL